MYLTLYVSRYLDLLDHQQAPYLVVHKLGYIGATVMALLCFHFFSKTYQKDADTCPAWAIALLMLMVAFCLTADSTVIEILWTWSQLLEGFAMVPQYVCSYRNAKAGLADSCGVSAWICLMGAYKFCYMLNWMHKKSRIQWYWDPNSWLCGIVNCSFFVDYVLFRLVNVSCLRRLTLACDDGLHVVGEELQNRLGGCLLSPGQRYIEVGPVDCELQGQQSAKYVDGVGVKTDDILRRSWLIPADLAPCDAWLVEASDESQLPVAEGHVRQANILNFTTLAGRRRGDGFALKVKTVLSINPGAISMAMLRLMPRWALRRALGGTLERAVRTTPEHIQKHATILDDVVKGPAAPFFTALMAEPFALSAALTSLSRPSIASIAMAANDRIRMECDKCGYKCVPQWLNDKAHCLKCQAVLRTRGTVHDAQREVFGAEANGENRRAAGEVSTFKVAPSSAMESVGGTCATIAKWQRGSWSRAQALRWAGKCGRGEAGISTDVGRPSHDSMARRPSVDSVGRRPSRDGRRPPSEVSTATPAGSPQKSPSMRPHSPLGYAGVQVAGMMEPESVRQGSKDTSEGRTSSKESNEAAIAKDRTRMTCHVCGYKSVPQWMNDKAHCLKCDAVVKTRNSIHGEVPVPENVQKDLGASRLPGEASTYKAAPGSAMESASGTCSKSPDGVHHWKYGKCNFCQQPEGKLMKGTGVVANPGGGKSGCEKGGKCVFKFSKCTKCGRREY
ncbi:unnamed protein product [Effrenium voratum]|nr:unnamed protein product [Effrenium voratum]